MLTSVYPKINHVYFTLLTYFYANTNYVNVLVCGSSNMLLTTSKKEITKPHFMVVYIYKRDKHVQTLVLWWLLLQTLLLQ